MNSTKVITTQRENTHGSFKNTATIIQSLKRAFRTTNPKLKGYEYGQDLVVDECLDMMFNKIGRTGSGNTAFFDHYQDIAGYALLTLEYLESAGDNFAPTKYSDAEILHGGVKEALDNLCDNLISTYNKNAITNKISRDDNDNKINEAIAKTLELIAYIRVHGAQKQFFSEIVEINTKLADTLKNQ